MRHAIVMWKRVRCQVVVALPVESPGLTMEERRVPLDFVIVETI